MKRILFVVATLALLLSACGPQATPTIDPAQVQASAMAAANTMVAMTQAAIPTATPIPPTPVPSPTFEPSPTPIPLPTLSVQASPTITTSSSNSSNPSNDPCNGPMSDNGGPDIKNVHIVNENNVPIILSLYLNKNAFAECGYRSFTMGSNQSTDVSNLKVGCYFAGAFVGEKNVGKQSKAFGNFCIMDDSHGWAVRVMAEQITLVGP
jgi:hypothetical protein